MRFDVKRAYGEVGPHHKENVLGAEVSLQTTINKIKQTNRQKLQKNRYLSLTTALAMNSVKNMKDLDSRPFPS